MNAPAQKTDLAVAQTILSQLGGSGRLAMMCGCKDFIGGSDWVQFKVGSNAKKVTVCRIGLAADDTYRVEFYAGRGLNIRKCSEHEGIYCDRLRPLFEEQTGMYLTF